MAQAGLGAWSRPVLISDGRPLAVADVVVAAHWRGELQASWTHVLRLVACAHHAAALEATGDLAADEETLQSMSDQFRYDRDLITADETERWLEDRGLTLDDFDAHILRRYWGDVLAEPVEPEVLDYRSAPDDLQDVLVSDLVLSGELDRMARALGWRIAAAHADPDPLVPDDDADAPHDEPEVADAVTAAWAAHVGADQQWVERAPRLEAAFERERERLLTRDRIVQALARRRLALSRVDLETVDVDTLDAAREVALCAHEDGLSMTDIAAEGGYRYERAQVVLEDLASDVQQQLLRRAVGEMLDAVAHEGGFHVHRLLGRAEPDPDDEDVRTRVERLLLDEHFDELMRECVQWPQSGGGA